MRCLSLVILLLWLFPHFVSAAGHTSGIAIIHAPDNRPCLFFQLEGVGEADPVKLNGPWVAVPVTHYGYDTIVAIMQSAHMGELPVSVSTTETIVTECSGLAKVNAVKFSRQ